MPGSGTSRWREARVPCNSYSCVPRGSFTTENYTLTRKERTSPSHTSVRMAALLQPCSSRDEEHQSQACGPPAANSQSSPIPALSRRGRPPPGAGPSQKPTRHRSLLLEWECTRPHQQTPSAGPSSHQESRTHRDPHRAGGGQAEMAGHGPGHPSPYTVLQPQPRATQERAATVCRTEDWAVQPAGTPVPTHPAQAQLPVASARTPRTAGSTGRRRNSCLGTAMLQVPFDPKLQCLLLLRPEHFK